jgi:hypothetical protein
LGLAVSYHACDALQGLLQLFLSFFLGTFPSARHHVCDIVRGMNILEIALSACGGVGRLAYILDLKQNVISNWRLRGSVPKGWETVIRLKFAKQIAQAEKLG